MKNRIFHFVHVDTLQQAKELPCVFNNYAIFYKGKFESVNLILDPSVIKRFVKK